MRCLILLMMTMSGNLLWSQDFASLYYPEEDFGELPFNLVREIHSFDDFIGRFNGELNGYGKALDASNPLFKQLKSDPKLLQKFRLKIIGSLMSEKFLSKNEAKAIHFAELASNLDRIDFLTSNWHVVVPIHGKWKGKSLSALMKVKIQALSDNTCRWIISDIQFERNVESVRSHHVPVDICQEIYIPPSAHDNGFIALNRVLRGEESLSNHILNTNPNLSKLAQLLDSGYKPYFNTYFYKIAINENLGFTLDENYWIIDTH